MLKSEIGNMPFEKQVAFNLGAGIKIGQEIDFILNINRIYPNLNKEECYKDFLDGLASRFKK